MSTESELETNCRIADAKLGVAESLGWSTATFAALAGYLYSNSWLAALGIGVVAYVLATHWFKKEHALAWDAYERATGTGKYYRSGSDDRAA